MDDLQLVLLGILGVSVVKGINEHAQKANAVEGRQRCEEESPQSIPSCLISNEN